MFDQRPKNVLWDEMHFTYCSATECLYADLCAKRDVKCPLQQELEEQLYSIA